MVDIKKIRTMLGYSQQGFAKKLNLNNAYLCRLEKGKLNLTERLKDSLILKFNVNKDYLDGKSNKIFIDKYYEEKKEADELDKFAREKLNNENYEIYNSLSQELENIINSPRCEDEDEVYNIIKQLNDKNFSIIRSLVLKLYLKQKKNEDK